MLSSATKESKVLTGSRRMIFSAPSSELYSEARGCCRGGWRLVFRRIRCWLLILRFANPGQCNGLEFVCFMGRSVFLGRGTVASEQIGSRLRKIIFGCNLL